MTTDDKIILPEKYYLDNFHFLLKFVKERYDAILSDSEHQFIAMFSDLSEDAQCLYVRISNRKGQFFLKEKLNYSEITSIENAAIELQESEFVYHQQGLEIDALFQLLSIYNKPIIVKKLKAVGAQIDSTASKAEIILEAIESIAPQILEQLFYDQKSIITQAGIAQLDMIKLLFFGNEYGSMTDFVVRDVGHAKFMDIDESKLGFSFDTREEVEAAMHLSILHQDFSFMENNVMPLVVLQWFHSIDITHLLSLTKVEKRAIKLIHKVGYCLERNKYLEEALSVYTLSSASPLRERMIRVFNKQKAFDKALKIAEEILTDPNDNKEYYLALDVINKQAKKIKQTTRRQKLGISIQIDSRFKHEVENGTLDHFEQLGFEGIHSENMIFSTLFGLCFWDEIFDAKHKAIYQPLQHTPSDLDGTDFYAKRKKDIELKLQQLSTKSKILAQINRSIDQNEGITNRFVIWDEHLLSALRTMIEVLKPKQIKALLQIIAFDPRDRLSGFPDLFIWRDKEYWFYEVKSPNDHLSEKQLFWLEQFKNWKILSEVVLVDWV